MVAGGGQAGGLGLEMGSSSNHFLLLSPSTLGSAIADLVLLPEFSEARMQDSPVTRAGPSSHP